MTNQQFRRLLFAGVACFAAWLLSDLFLSKPQQHPIRVEVMQPSVGNLINARPMR